MMRNTRFTVVDLLGVVTDLSIFYILLSKGVALDLANVTSFFVAILIVYILNARWSCARIEGAYSCTSIQQHLTFLMIAVLALFLRSGVLAGLINLWSWSPEAAILPAIAGGLVVNYFGSVLFIFPGEGAHTGSDTQRKVFALAIIAYVVALRIVYLGMPELLYEEAYYWKYAKYLNIGYLDHPPMVAWIIWLSTKILGDTEFAIRIGAFACWLIAVLFSFRLTSQLFNKLTAIQAVLLLSILPYFWGVGYIMTPDSPLVACWAGALYFLKRALIDERPQAWFWVGICVGLGMLSKYTMALLGPATLSFLLLDRRSRRWLFRPQPYLSLMPAFLLFSPVILWNLNHDWASFTFQGPRRLHEGFDFSLHQFIGGVLLLLTPMGVVAIISIIKARIVNRTDDNQTLGAVRQRHYTFGMVFTLVPLAVFLTWSLARSVKLNWTGPLWLGVIPFIAYELVSRVNLKTRPPLLFMRHAWPATIVTAVFVYSATLYYLTLGFPGIPYPTNLSLLGWQHLAQHIEQIEDEIEARTGVEPLVVGMDKNKTASGLAFYRNKFLEETTDDSENEGVLNTLGGRHLFGGNGLMYSYWFPKERLWNRDMILVGREPDTLASPRILSRFRKTGPVHKAVIEKNGMQVGLYYYCFAEGYQES